MNAAVMTTRINEGMKVMITMPVSGIVVVMTVTIGGRGITTQNVLLRRLVMGKKLKILEFSYGKLDDLELEKEFQYFRSGKEFILVSIASFY